MRPPSKRQFRNLTIIGLVLIFSGSVMEHRRIPTPSQEITDALNWNGYGSILSDESSQMLFYVQIGAVFVGVVGFLTFGGWSRCLLLGVFIGSYAIIPMSGLFVTHGVSLAFIYFGSGFFMVPFVLSFFQPCSEYFEPRVSTKTIDTNPHSSTLRDDRSS